MQKTRFVGIHVIRFVAAACASAVLSSFLPVGHVSAHTTGAQKVILDTDIGDDIDDAFALALLLRSPEVKVLAVTTAFGDTHLRARLASRLVKEAGDPGIPVYAGVETPPKTTFTQAKWARQTPDHSYPDAIAFILDAIRRSPGEITLIEIAPESNIGALLARDPATFRKLKRVVLMGGSIYRGYDDVASRHPDAEWNIEADIPAAQALFNSGVPLYVMPLDSTQMKLDAARQAEIFGIAAPLTDALKELTHEWSMSTHNATPTLYDAVAAGYAIHPELCPTTPMRIVVDARGYTKKVEGPANARACLKSDADEFFRFLVPRLR